MLKNGVSFDRKRINLLDVGSYGRFARIQILTLAEIIQQGKRPHLPNIDRIPVGKVAARAADPRSPKLL
jgi:hypothetical protein